MYRIIFSLLFFFNTNVFCQEKIGNNIPEISFLEDNTIDAPFIGHGVQWSAYPHADSDTAEWGLLMTDDKWKELYKRLDYLQPHIIRVMDVASWRYYKGLDTEGVPIIDYNTQEVRSLYKLLDYCQHKNIKVLFGEWGTPGFWNKDKSIPGIYRADDDRWISMIIGYLKHLIIDKGYTCIAYYNLVNEPNGFWASTDGDWDQWSKGFLKLDAALRKNDLLKYVKLVGPDAVVQWDHPTHPKKALDWVYSTIHELGSVNAMFDIHMYADQQLVRTGNLEQFLSPMHEAAKDKKKPFILGELGMKYTGELAVENKKRGKADPQAGADDSSMFVYDYFYGVDMADATIQSMLAGFGSAIAWDLDDAMHTVDDKGDKTQLKKWGMWNILGEELYNNPKDLVPRPWSYVWTLLCNLLPPDSIIIKAKSSLNDKSVRCVAAKKDIDFTAIVVNQSKQLKKYYLRTDVDTLPEKLYLYEYSENYRPVNKDNFPVYSKVLKYKSTEGGIYLEIKPNSVVFVSTILVN
ncbi:cellulase family glycosylhydrolase [Aquimarina sp. RZ0]|uniref:cellulase family glycosylhydrolase n=1 Tax=Aquimarina sp. RZ0 TaxID=2607730 RepID=UPI0011F1D927|nr:cellulase family glycosylhydrolase [Aquimarina sp. RZ0]KAA1243695.1 glycoside hydrolase family 5 protein [Aquimarina sp. RZ0]